MLWLLAVCPAAFAAANVVTLTWQPDPSWQVAAGGTYLDLPVDTVTASRRLAVRVYSYGTLIGEVWDDPARREVNVGVEMGSSPIAHIRAQAVAYECGPWKASTAVAVGDQVCGGDYPSTQYSMVVSTAGTTGAEEPEWPRKHSFRLALAKTLGQCTVSSNTTQATCTARGGTWTGNAIDNGDGTVGIPVAAHLFRPGNIVTIAGTANYNGTYTLPAQTLGAADVVVITAAYVAETFTGAETIAIADSSVVDNGDGTVDIPCPAHGFVSGQDVTVSGTTAYDGPYTIGTQTDPDWLTITATYVPEQITGGYAIDTTITDGTAIWTFTDAATPLTVLESEPSRRLIGRANGVGQLGQSGTKFRVRTAP